LYNSRDTLIRQHFDELVKAFPGLVLSEDFPGRWVVRGLLSFSATFNGITIEDTFTVLIIFPDDYPNSPPTVQETGGRIPAEFHQYPDRALCLGAPVEVLRRFKTNPRLVTFMETLVVEYLYGYAFFEKYGEMPFDELSHGAQGIREYYQDLFETDNVQIVLALLKLMADGTYRGHHVCLCGSEKILRKCHGLVMLELLKKQPKERFLSDATNVLLSLKENEMKNFDRDLLPKDLKREIDEMARERARREKCA